LRLLGDTWQGFSMNRYISALALFLAAISGGGALACQGSHVILDENFQKLDYSGWAAPNDKLSYGPSGAVLKPSANRGYYTFNNHYTSDGTDLCTTAIWPAGDIKSAEFAGTVGILFWMKDTANFYSAVITNQGDFVIDRFIENSPTVQIIGGPEGKDVHLDFVNKEPGGKNEIEVQISGTKVTLFVNERKVIEFSGQPPPGSGGSVGIFASNQDAVFAYTFHSFRIAAYP
jgi:hypothetical protein